MQAALAKVYGHGLTAWLVLAAGLAVSAAGAWLTARQLEGEDRLRFEAAVSDARAAIGSRVNDYADVLRGAHHARAAAGVRGPGARRQERRPRRLSGLLHPPAR
jgi:hypothetical protein